MKTLLVLLGPTGVGKTALGIKIAQHFSIPVISADSRQIYKGLKIGTAAPSFEEQKLAQHFFIDTKELDELYSAGQFEIDVINLLPELFKKSDFALMVGGSMMYIDAVCNGMDDIPNADPEVRKNLNRIYENEGIESLQAMLKLLDPEHYQRVDLKNYRRVIHAVEVCFLTGRPYSEILTTPKKKRDFNIIKIGITRPTEDLYNRINHRVDAMIAEGLEAEAADVYKQKQLNALNTVGYKEWFAYWDGEIESKEKVIELIKRNSRHYAKKQLTWFKRDKSIKWFTPDDYQLIINHIEDICKN
ncbi:MAG: tRNA (adenosine(37)-N6)-dimethylallyltransferase MiaA [Paludibacteraceae bacterium]|jgi:tRNA dimethylallyltransferase|nr:tRNA (adenosine(37)-N6)-dimethylallyltransferase MiaA [Paludibacteraceae bacterium]OQA48179.1 MAG: tRNA dimethylallyltransferase [Bacteroidetes bacterium ADurb.Bin302]HOH95668.1 tRNA (adenosine(37)-N6)-dimethylallyltransferase MiaA [Candidatus Enterocola sp.]HPG55943.1 tRNA (adenosine(37)-N6)-dimethylallyltransferase MiaA [Candidatus Enterocola sp.]